MNMIMKFITKNYYNLMDLITPFVLTMTSVPLVHNIFISHVPPCRALLDGTGGLCWVSSPQSH